MSESEQLVRKSAIERVDEGLRQYMIKVFNYMGLGLVVTTLAAYVTLYTPVITWMFSVDEAAQTVSLSALGWIITLAPLAMIFGFNAVLNKGSMAAAQAMFWAFSVVMGMSLADVGLLYTGASIVNIFLKSSGLYYAISYIAVLTFTVLTAYDVQVIKNMYQSSDSEDNLSRKAIAGAMNLYLDFINLFIYLMRIMGDRK